MASYFGEVIHPSSRAFWNGEDDDDTIDYSQENLEFTIEWTEPEPSRFEKFVVVEGDMVIDFVESCLLQDAKTLCTIGNGADKKTKIYSVNDLYICTIDSKLNLAQAGQLTETIEPLLKKSNTLLALTCDHISHFKSEEEKDSASLLKSLYSKKARANKNPKISTLNQPNIVTGVCAGVLSYAEIIDLNCIMYILYTDTFALDSKTASPLTELFSGLLGKTVPNYTGRGSSYFNKGNLYL